MSSNVEVDDPVCDLGLPRSAHSHPHECNFNLPAAAASPQPCKSFVIQHDTARYGHTSGSEHFGERIYLSGVTIEQAWRIADALSGYSDAGLTDQFEVEGEWDVGAHDVAAERERCAKIADAVNEKSDCYYCGAGKTSQRRSGAENE